MSDCGKKILIQNVYPYEVPKVPKDSTLIINHEIEDISEQYWRVPEFPDFKLMSAYEIEKFIYREWERMEKGVHFYNNGEVVYINGAHYEYLTYWKLDYDLEFRHVDRLYFYFDEFIDSYPSTYGKAVYKPRVGGFTAKENFLAYRKSKAKKGRHVALINTTIDNAIRIQYKVIRDCYLQYPDFIKPKIKNVNGRIPETGLEYIATMENDIRKYLKGWIIPFPPKANSLDGKRLHYIFFDEISKLESIDPSLIIKPYFKTMFNPSKNEIEGRMAFVSTLGTDDNLMKKAIEFYLRLWHESDIEKANEDGFTTSKLLRYFISCYEVKNIDKYGFADIERNMAEQEKTLQDLISTHGEFSTAHVTELRENPRTIEDIANFRRTGATFNVHSRITKRKEALLNLAVEQRGYITGKFMWNGSEVIFDTNPIYSQYGWKIKSTKRMMKNLCRKVSGNWVLPKRPEGVVGYDGVIHNNPTSKHFSQPAIKIFKRLDHYSQNGIKNQMIGQYYGRQEDNDDVSEQAALAALFFGFHLAPERNTGIKWFVQNGFEHMIPISWYDNGRGLMMTTGKGERNVFEHAIRDMYKWVIGKQIDPISKQEIFNVETTVFEESLEQQESFTPNGLSEHDIIAADLQCFLVVEKLIPEDNKTKQRPHSTLHAMYHAFT